MCRTFLQCLADLIEQHYGNCLRVFADCKCTEKHSFSLKLADLYQMQDRAAEMGKRFIMPIRFHPAVGPQDYVLLGLHDFAEMQHLIEGKT